MVVVIHNIHTLLQVAGTCVSAGSVTKMQSKDGLMETNITIISLGETVILLIVVQVYSCLPESPTGPTLASVVEDLFHKVGLALATIMVSRSPVQVSHRGAGSCSTHINQKGLPNKIQGCFDD